MIEIVMPKLADSMEAGTIVSWLKADGADVSSGEEIVEIETDKATVAHAADVSGVLRILASEGTTVPVGDVIATLGESAGDRVRATTPSTTSPPRRPEAPPKARSVGAALATPLARRSAQLHDVTIAELEGSGPLGRITRTDVLRKAGIALPPPVAAAGPATPRPADATTRVQQVIAQRMSESRSTIPEFEVQAEVTMDAAIALRKDLKGQATCAPVPTLNDLIIKACAIALRRHPGVNASYGAQGVEHHEQVNVGFAVAREGMLLVPVVSNADGLSLGSIAQSTRTLAERARTGEATLGDFAGGTFTVSNLGMFRVTAIRPVINPPQVAILGVGALKPTLIREGDEICDRTRMTLTLSCDHRALYGADAARFLADVQALLETPLSLVAN